MFLINYYIQQLILSTLQKFCVCFLWPSKEKEGINQGQKAHGASVCLSSY